MKTEEFKLEVETVKPSVRLAMRMAVREIALTIEKGTSDQEVRRKFRLGRPESTYRSQWLYKVYREEVRRIMGLAVGPLAKRTISDKQHTREAREWLRQKGFKIYSDEPFK